MYVGVRAGGGIGDEIEDPAGDEFEVERIVFDITFFFFVIVILLAIIQGESRCLFQGSVWPRHTVLTGSSHTNTTNLFQAWSSMPLESCVTSKSRWKKIWRRVWLTRNSLLRAFHQSPDLCHMFHEFRLRLTSEIRRKCLISASMCILAVLVSPVDVCQSTAGLWRLCQI